jgi:MerR family transcriptional regulator/heat shock protein HspR
VADDATRGVYMISVAAELAGMHPQTLRIYEARGLITPKRSPKNTRLYSAEDVERLRRIQELTTELGMNLAGVEKVFELEGEMARMRRRDEARARPVPAALELAAALGRGCADSDPAAGPLGPGLGGPHQLQRHLRVALGRALLNRSGQGVARRL